MDFAQDLRGLNLITSSMARNETKFDKMTGYVTFAYMKNDITVLRGMTGWYPDVLFVLSGFQVDILPIDFYFCCKTVVFKYSSHFVANFL